MSKAKNIPWLMWGSSTTITVTTTGLGAGDTSPPAQLASIDYGRPDTWTFFFMAAIISRTASIVDPNNIQVFFDLQFGVGRSNSQPKPDAVIGASGFERYQFDNIVANANAQKYSTTALGPLRFAGDTASNLIAEFPAQVINCSARVVANANAGRIDVSVAAYFSPRTHVRPDWYGPQALGSGER